MRKATQGHRAMEIVTPLGHDVLLFRGMNSKEELSRLSEFEIDVLSEKGDIDANKLLGKNVTVRLELHDDSFRCFNGYVTRFQQVGFHGRYHAYHVSVRPWLWFLTRTADCRIFQEKTVPEIIKQVFSDHTVADIKDELTYTYHKRTYCVQYRETDFDFLSRLMEQEGIYYYFTHADGRHTLVLADAYSAHAPTTGYETLPYIDSERLVRPEQEYVSQWNHVCEIQSGKYEIDDYDFERPSVELAARSKMSREHALSDYEIYDYPGEYLKTADGEQYVDARIDELQSQFEIARGESNARGLASGALLKLTGQTRSDQNREYLILSAAYNLTFNAYETGETQSATCTCQFSALNSKQQFRPRRSTPRPFVQGPQTALVVGPSGDEIYTDKYGRVKVQFHWDRYGKKNENSSCWVRPSHPWAGKNWGMIAIPRIGQEVIVDFLEGDPDQPIITGRVYNAEQMPPWELPANMTQSGVLTRSTKGGAYGTANAIRFEDKKGSEQLWIHAEKNQDIEVENDETHWVGHDRTKTVDHDETTHVKHDRTETVDNNETITVGVNRTESVGNNETITIGNNRSITVGASETATVVLQRTHTVGVNETITVGAAQEITVGAAQAVTIGATQTVNVGASQSISVGANMSEDVGGAQSYSVAKARTASVGENDSLKVGKNLVIDAGDSVTIKTGSASITMKKDGTIQIKGKDITIEGSGKINVKASSDVVVKGSKVGIN